MTASSPRLLQDCSSQRPERPPPSLPTSGPTSDSGGAADDLAELSGDFCLPRTVVDESELVEHLPCVLRGALHRAHPLRLLREGRVEVAPIDGGPIVELVKVVPDLEDRRLERVDVDSLGPLGPVHCLTFLLGERMLPLCVEGHHGEELVTDDLQPPRVGSDDALRDQRRSEE